MKIALIALAAAGLATTAAASPCGDKLAQLQQRYNSAPIVAGAGPVSAPPSAAESETAKLHRQPAPASAADAAAPALSDASVRDARFRNAMEEARAADHSGDAGNCASAARQAEQALNR